ncbi:MAG: cardiolipin synthase [Thermodesulfobacteriota bacterium]|nr:cardiolipin synthase [Thermodesulfobacteriota bacterium]
MADTAWLIILYLLSVLAAIHALLHKRNPPAALGWIVVCLGLPGFGAFFYLLLGMNRIRTRARSWQDGGRGIYPLDSDEQYEAEDSCEVSAPLVVPFKTQNYQLIRQLSDRVTRRHLLSGNRVELLHNGDRAYPVMLNAIAAARQSIALSTYIFDTQQTGRTFVAALCAAAQRGVEVRVLVDGLGELYSWPLVHRLFVGSKVQVARFLPFTLRRRGLHLNLRNHRKLLVIDGEIGFTGGMNISHRHLLDNLPDEQEPAAARVWPSGRVVDLHFKVGGPVVGQMQETFREDWNFATDETFSGRNYPPPIVGSNCLCRGISAGPNEEYEKLVWIVVGALNCARKRVSIMTPYFIPDRMVVAALNAAALRGVEVEIILPQKNNLPYVHWASRGSFWELLEYGVKIYYQPPPFVHSKLLLMDDHYALIGSANMDPRSQRLNFEFNLELYDEEVNASLRHHFDAVRQTARPITLEQMDGRGLLLKLRDNFFRLFTPFL